MGLLTGLFWNTSERRLRALWRIGAVVMIMVSLMTPVQSWIIFGAFDRAVTQGVADPALRADAEAVQGIFQASPGALLLSALAACAVFFFAVWFAGRFIDYRRLADYGLHLNRNWWRDLAVGLLIGGVMAGMVFVIELAVGWIVPGRPFAPAQAGAGFAPGFVMALANLLLIAFYEELFFRGYVLKNLAEGLNLPVIGPAQAISAAAAIGALFFAISQLTDTSASSAFSLTNLILLGLLYALGVALTGELALPLGLHIGWGLLRGYVFGFPTGGFSFPGGVVVPVTQGGPALWTGGASGPEAGLLGSLAVIVGGLLVVLWVRWQKGALELYTPLAEPPERARVVADEENT